ncbi:MAG: hypothetical protein AB3N16_14665, partial [Flavobacteriaceae bacterium]
MSNEDYLNDLTEIKNLMRRSSRFLSLSGLSGILAGMYALIGAAIAHRYFMPQTDGYVTLHSHNFKMMLLILALIALASVVTAYFLTLKKA